MRIACVVHRYGADIAGGSETHCRQVAEHLAAVHDVTVLTTCATDHVTWNNTLPAGASMAGRVRVRRFPVARARSLRRFAEAGEIAQRRNASEAEQEQWFRENGPDAPELLEHLASHGRDYDRVLFWAFRYAVTYFGLPLVRDRAVLVPTVENDPVIAFGVLERFFSLPAGLVFLTPEEQALVVQRAAAPLAPSVVIGVGLDPAPDAPAHQLDSLGLRDPFILYLGRVDPNKGCETLLRHFIRLQASGSRPVQLVLAGPANMPIPRHPQLVPLGTSTPRRATHFSRAPPFWLSLPGTRASASCCWKRGIAEWRRWSTVAAPC